MIKGYFKKGETVINLEEIDGNRKVTVVSNSGKIDTNNLIEATKLMSPAMNVVVKEES